MVRRFRIQTPAEREELRLISQVQRLNCYPEIVRRLTAGDSANSVALWASGLKVDGVEGCWSPLYWRKHIAALGKHVRVAKDELRTRKPVPSKPEDVAASLEAQVDELLAADVIPRSSTRVSRHVEKALKQVDAKRTLKFLCLEQMDRLEKTMALEAKTGLTADGNKQINVLVKIAASLGEIEIGEQWMRGKDGRMPMSKPKTDSDEEVNPGDRTSGIDQVEGDG